MSSVAALGAMPAFADDPVVPSSLDTVVVTGTRQATKIGDVVGNDAAVKADDIQFIRPDRPSEVLNMIPGVAIEQQNGAEHFTAIRSPAFNGSAGAGSFLYLEDGVPMRSPGFGEINALKDVNIEQAGQVEVVRGPGTSLYGSNAEYGMINVIPRNPSKDFTNELDVQGGMTFGGLNSPSERILGSSSGTWDNFGARLSLSDNHEDGWRVGTRVDEQKFVLRTLWTGVEDTVTGTISGGHLDEGAGAYVVGSSSVKAPHVYTDQYANLSNTLATSNGIPGDFRQSATFRAQLRWDHELSDSLQLSVTPYVRSIDDRFLANFLPSWAVDSTHHDGGGVQTALYKTLEGGHSIVVGTDIDYAIGGYGQYQPLSVAQLKALGDPSTPTTANAPGGWQYNFGVGSIIAASYIRTEWRVLEHTKVTFGARVESTTYDYTNMLSSGSNGYFERLPSRSDQFLTFRPQGGAVQEWSKNLATYLNVATGGRAPQITDLYELQTTQQPGQVKPENMTSVELGTRGNIASTSFDTSVYYMHSDHYFYRDSAGLNESDGLTKHFGWENAVRTPIAEGFDIGAATSWAYHAFDYNRRDLTTGTSSDGGSSTVTKGSLLPNAPRVNTDLRLGFEPVKGRGRLELEWQVMGSYVTDSADIHSYGGYDLFNLRGTMPINDGISAYFKVTNLMNIKYAERATVSTVGTEEYFPGEPLTVMMGTSMKF